VSQAGITRADKVAYLETHGWTKLPRKYGAAVRWEDPVTRTTWRTESAYEQAKRRERT
jgi:hypothetical protein